MKTVQLDQIDIEIIKDSLTELERVYRSMGGDYYHTARAGMVNDLRQRFSRYPLTGCCLYQLSPQMIERVKNGTVN